MFTVNSFGIIGGDIRQLYCARGISEDGFGVSVCGFGRCENRMGLSESALDEVLESSDALILPLPISKDGETLHAPYAERPVPLAGLVNLIGKERLVFGGMRGRAEQSLVEGLNFHCYSSREEFAAANAVPTAEGALEIAIREYDGTLNSARILVIGYGRIGRVLSMMLRGIGAAPTVSVRKLRDAEMVRAAGMTPLRTERIEGSYDIIFNTVPALVLDARTLARSGSKAIIIDLSSLPGGVDDNAAQRMSIKVIHALSLPGKTAPRTAGIIIKNTICHMIDEIADSVV